jgi:hypothetical protein
MDVGQLTQLATWLDEEHRRDKAELIKLQQQVQRQDGELQDQTQVIRSLEERVASLQAQQMRFTSLETSIEQLKEEVVQMLAQADDRRQQEAREAGRVRAIERDNVSRALNEIRRDLERLPHLAEESKLRKAEQTRIGETLLSVKQELTALSQETENKLRSIPFLEDGRQQDSKRIARLQQESLEALKRLEQLGSRVQTLEDVSQRQERDTGELKQLLSQLRTSQREFIEGQLLETEQIKRELAEWIEVIEVHVKSVEGFGARLQEFSESFREDRKIVENIERFQELIKREQTQVSELQRLAEERQKRQLEQWQEENEKRWRKELLRWDHQWGEQAKANHTFENRFGEVEGRQSLSREQIDAAWKFLGALVAYETQEARRRAGELTQHLEERPRTD